MLSDIACSVGSIEKRTRHEYENYTELRAGMRRIYKDCKVMQKNVVFDFLGEFITPYWSKKYRL